MDCLVLRHIFEGWGVGGGVGWAVGHFGLKAQFCHVFPVPTHPPSASTSVKKWKKKVKEGENGGKKTCQSSYMHIQFHLC